MKCNLIVAPKTGKTRMLTFVVLVVLSGVLYFLQDRWFILNTDDFSFSTVSEIVTNDQGEPMIVHLKPVTSWADALRSQAACYLLYNGRFVIHTIAQWLCGTRSELFIACCNTLMWMVLFACFVTLSFCRERWRPRHVVVAFAVLWLLMPMAMREFTSSVACSLDYLWTGAANLLLLLAYERCGGTSRHCRWWQLAAMVVLAMVVGSMQESYSMGVAAGLIAHAVTHRRELSPARRALVLGYLLGVAVCLLSPANYSRAHQLGYAVRWQVLVDVAKVPVFTLTLAAMAVALLWRPRAVAEVMRRSLVLVVAIVVNLAFCIFVAYTASWQLTSVSLFTAVLLLRLYARLTGGHAVVGRILAAVAACATLAIYVPQHGYRHEVWRAQHQMMADALAPAPGGIVSIRQAFDVDRRYHALPLSAVWRVYLRNEVTPLVLNDMHLAPSMLSRYLTRCAHPALVTAILPDDPQVLADSFGGGTGVGNHQGDGGGSGTEVTHCGPYTLTRARDPQEALLSADLVPCQQWQYNGHHYCLYNGHH